VPTRSPHVEASQSRVHPWKLLPVALVRPSGQHPNSDSLQSRFEGHLAFHGPGLGVFPSSQQPNFVSAQVLGMVQLRLKGPRDTDTPSGQQPNWEEEHSDGFFFFFFLAHFFNAGVDENNGDDAGDEVPRGAEKKDK